METFMKLISDDFKRRHYPDGYFNAIVKGFSSMTVWYVLMVVMILFSLPCFLLSVRGLLINKDNLERGVLIICAVVFGIGIIFVLAGVLIVRFGKKLSGKTREDWIKKFVKNSGYPESVIREFDQQLMTSESYLLTLDGEVDPDTLLTADFIKSGSLIMRRSDIKTACLFLYEDNLVVGNLIKPIKTLHVGLASANREIWLKARKDLGSAFLAMLKEQNPQIDTRDGEVLSNKEFIKLIK